MINCGNMQQNYISHKNKKTSRKFLTSNELSKTRPTDVGSHIPGGIADDFLTQNIFLQSLDYSKNIFPIHILIKCINGPYKI